MMRARVPAVLSALADVAAAQQYVACHVLSAGEAESLARRLAAVVVKFLAERDPVERAAAAARAETMAVH